jgi:hypothetical protein
MVDLQSVLEGCEDWERRVVPRLACTENEDVDAHRGVPPCDQISQSVDLSPWNDTT